jgi:hypothetical protein
MGALVRAVDWTATPLGPVEGWPRSLVARRARGARTMSAIKGLKAFSVILMTPVAKPARMCERYQL